MRKNISITIYEIGYIFYTNPITNEEKQIKIYIEPLKTGADTTLLLGRKGYNKNNENNKGAYLIVNNSPVVAVNIITNAHLGVKLNSRLDWILQGVGDNYTSQFLTVKIAL